MRTPAVNQVIATKLGFGEPGCIKHCVLCVPKRPRAKQKSLYGASGGASGRGKKEMTFGFFGSFASMMQGGWKFSRQSASSASFVQTRRLASCGCAASVMIGKTVWKGIVPNVLNSYCTCP